jgi:hypothetical protein
MDLRRLRELLAAYGADPARWPDEERAEAEALLASSAEATREQKTAAELDALLDRVPADPVPPALAARVLADARAAATTARARRRRRLVITLGPLAAAAGLVVWLVGGPAPSSPIRSAAIPLAALGTYETPTDELLASPLLDVVDAEPALGCAEPWEECDSPAAPARDSRSGDPRRVHA